MKKNIEEELNSYRDQSLESYVTSGVVDFVEILSTNDSCENCKKWQGVEIPLAKAMEEQPLPVRECGHKNGCRCCYIPVVKE